MCNGISIALGNFDGLHKGHLSVILSAKKIADENSFTAGVLLFLVHPQKVLSGIAPAELITMDNKRNYIENLGVKVFEIDFENIKNLSANEFFYDILINRLNVKAISCGENYRFGKNAKGDVNYLQALCKKESILLSVSPLEALNGEVISSTAIRTLLQNGEVEKANQMLSHPFSYNFTVVDGQHLGRKLGLPTINQYFDENFVKVKNGVYSSTTEVEGKTYESITNIGTRPTVNSGVTVRSETHILGLEKNLYGTNPTVALLSFIREEKKFNSVEELKEQIVRDINIIKESECFLCGN